MFSAPGWAGHHGKPKRCYEPSAKESRAARRDEAWKDGQVVTVPVYVPSYAWSGDTHVVTVGDRVAWELSVLDMYLPEHLLQTVTVTLERVDSRYPSVNWYQTLVRHGSFVAWWDAGRPVSGDVELRPVCAVGDPRKDEAIPEATGTVTRLFWALDLLRQRPDGPWDRVPGIGLVEVPSTTVDPDQESFTAYFPGEAPADAQDGHWRHLGWIAMLQCG